MRLPRLDHANMRRRAEQLGWLTVGLAVLALGLLVGAVVLASIPGEASQVDEVLVPLDVEFGSATGALLASAALLVAASFVGLAALQTAAVMRVLDPDRHLPPSPPSVVRPVRSVMLGALETDVTLVEGVAGCRPRRFPARRSFRSVSRCGARC